MYRNQFCHKLKYFKFHKLPIKKNSLDDLTNYILWAWIILNYGERFKFGSDSLGSHLLLHLCCNYYIFFNNLCMGWTIVGEITVKPAPITIYGQCIFLFFSILLLRPNNLFIFYIINAVTKNNISSILLMLTLNLKTAFFNKKKKRMLEEIIAIIWYLWLY